MKTFLHVRPTSPASRRGFTLIELVASLAIMMVVAGLSMPYTMSMLRGSTFNLTLINIGQSVDLGRQHAIANNTYTWVLLTEPVESDQTMYAAVMESRNGSDTLAWQTSALNISALPDLRLVVAPAPMPAAKLSDTPESLPNMPDTGASTPGRWGKVNLQVTSGGKILTFTRALQFTPTGQAMTSTTVARYIQMTVAGKNATASQKAVVLIGGLTGKCQLYRP
ncbi:MAG: Tfp pilus assembly protein FimT/FimU [Candidatus Methylacidiphilales bacterium]|nr:prepilin-type N-terminal cleavage/methylation domain-containing protein [Candidatus Methylacidiphilales bacterium]